MSTPLVNIDEGIIDQADRAMESFIERSLASKGQQEALTPTPLPPRIQDSATDTTQSAFDATRGSANSAGGRGGSSRRSEEHELVVCHLGAPGYRIFTCRESTATSQL